MNDGTITKAEKTKRLNLIRQMNSRKYRIQNKLKIAGQQALIDKIEQLADEQGIKEIAKLVTDFKESLDDSTDSESEDCAMEADI